MKKKALFLVFILFASLPILNASHLSNITINPEAINTTGYVNYSIVVYNTSGDPINKIQFQNTSGDSNRQFLYDTISASNWNFNIANDDLSATGTPNTAGYRIEVGESLTITVRAKASNLSSSGQITIMRIVTTDSIGATDSKQFSIMYDTQKPSAPTLSTPANGATINNIRPTLDWNAASDGDSGIKGYTLQWSPNDDFVGTGTVTKANLTSTSYTIKASEGLTEGTYYWRVYAVDNAGNISLSSTIRSFEVSPVPDLISPSNNTTTNDATPLFKWSSVPYASTYTIQISEESTFGTITLEKTVTTTQYELQLSESLSNGTYYWRIKTDLSTGYSDYYTLEVNKNIPNLISPPDNVEITDSRPTFEFTKIEDASSYTLKISPSSSFSPSDTLTISSGFNTGGTTVTYEMTSDLEDGTYYWKVAADGGPYSSYYKFTIGAVAPETPVLLSPTDGSAIQDTTPTFSWQTVSDASVYTLQYKKTTQTWEDAAERTLIGNTNTSFTVGSALEEAVYEWRVKCRNPKDIESAWSDVWSVIIDKTPPQIASPGTTGWSPPNGGVVEDNTPKFEWPAATDGGSGVEKYTMQYATENTFSDATTKENLYVSYYTPTVSLDNDTYFWRVKAVDKAGNESEFSEAMIVIINVPGQNTVTIVVKSSTGDEIADASVELGKYSTTTNSNGRAVFENVPDGTYNLTVSKEEYTTYTDVYDITGNTTIPITLTSTEENEVTIAVKDANNNMIEDAEVTLTPTTGSPMSKTTNSQGNAVFTAVKSGTYTLKVEKSGFSTYTDSIDVSRDQTFTATIKSRYSLTFTVIDAFADSPLEGAKVKIEELPEKTTDAQGKTSFTLQSGTYNVRVEKEGYDDGTGAGYTEIITMGSDMEKVIRLYKKGYDLIVGTVHFGDGTVPYQVVAYQDGKTSTYKTASPDQESGEFKMEVETGHEYEVGVVGYEDQKVKVVLSQTLASPKKNPITINRSGSIYGIVANEIGNVLVGATVELYTQEGELVTSVSSTKKGFTIENVSPGSYYIEIKLEGYKDFKSSVFSVKAKERYNMETLQIEAQKGVLNVVVQDQDGNNVNATVTVISNGETVAEKTAENGEASFQLQGGTYTIEASLEGYQKGTAEAEVADGKTVSKNIVLSPTGPPTTTPAPSPTGSLKVTVKDNEGNPIPDVNVFVDNEMKGKTDEEGVLLAEDVEEGSHQIKLTKADYIDKSFTKDVVAGQTVEEPATMTEEGEEPSGMWRWKYAVVALIVIGIVLFYVFRIKKITPKIPRRKKPFEEEEEEKREPQRRKRPGGLPKKPKT